MLKSPKIAITTSEKKAKCMRKLPCRFCNITTAIICRSFNGLRQITDRTKAFFHALYENADINASRNILAVGHTVLSVEGGCGKGRPVKQKASEIREEVT